MNPFGLNAVRSSSQRCPEAFRGVAKRNRGIHTYALHCNMIMHVATERVGFPQGKHAADARNDYVLLCRRNSSNIPAIHVKAYP